MPLKPGQILAQAKSLAPAEGLALLTAHRNDWAGVPPAYDAFIGRCQLRLGEPGAAAASLLRARDAYDEMPVEQRRDLGAALFLMGRIEAAGRELSLVLQAGAQVTRRAHRAAIDAYRHRRGEALDAPPTTPFRVLAEAEAMIEAQQLDAARQWMLDAERKHGPAWGEIPAEYHAVLGRVSFRCGDRATAIERLGRARVAFGDAVPPHIHQPLGTALFEFGRFAEAGQVLDCAVREGANLTRAELRIALNYWRRKEGSGDLLDTRFAQNHTVIDPDHRVVYAAVAKNACSLMKATIVLNCRHRDDYLSGGQKIHEYCSELALRSEKPPAIDAPGYFRCTLLRDPLRRALSAYLDKFVRGRLNTDYTAMQVARTIAEAQSMLGIGADPARSISFEEFVRYLSVTEDVRFDMHWMPQFHVVGTDLSIYDHVGTVERIDATLDLLATRFGYVAAGSLAGHLRKGERHLARFSETATLRAPYAALPEELASFDDGLPMPEQFFTPELRDLLAIRYHTDLQMHEAVKRKSG